MSRAVWLVLAAALAVPTACAGRSTSLESENAGEGSGGTSDTGGNGGRTTGAGASGSVGATGSGATGSGATGSGATGSGATGATSSGATGATGMGATGGTGSGGTISVGGSPACQPELDDRRCLIDSDCQLSGLSPCCGTARIHGVNKVTGCAQDPIACIGDCEGTQWITDTMEATYDLGVVQVRCEVGEPGAGVCVSYVNLDEPPPPTYCDGELCYDTEVCVHYATPGGPAPRCEPLFDGGMCPPDWKLDICPQTGALGCLEARLPPPPQCVDIGAACTNPVDCACLPENICGGVATECAGVMDRHVNCVDLSP